MKNNTLKWTKITEEVRPEFGKEYLLAQVRRTVAGVKFRGNRVFFGTLYSITEKEGGDITIKYSVECRHRRGELEYSIIEDATHFNLKFPELRYD